MATAKDHGALNGGLLAWPSVLPAGAALPRGQEALCLRRRPLLPDSSLFQRRVWVPLSPQKRRGTWCPGSFERSECQGGTRAPREKEPGPGVPPRTGLRPPPQRTASCLSPATGLLFIPSLEMHFDIF